MHLNMLRGAVAAYGGSVDVLSGAQCRRPHALKDGRACEAVTLLAACAASICLASYAQWVWCLPCGGDPPLDPLLLLMLMLPNHFCCASVAEGVCTLSYCGPKPLAYGLQARKRAR